MKAARLHGYHQPLAVENVPQPEVSEGEVLIRVAGAGVCHSDLHIMDGKLRLNLPLTPGHENTGYIEQMGSGVTGWMKGDAVAVYGAWGCGECRFCRQGEQQLCRAVELVGVTTDGGFAEYLKVRSPGYLIKLDGLDLVEAAPLTDAGLTPYHAVTKAVPFLYPGSTAVIIGLGGLGHYAVQIIKALCPEVLLIGVDVDDDKLKMAKALGADHTINGSEDVVAGIKAFTRKSGAQAIMDFVGSDGTLNMAAASLARKGILLLVGMAGGRLQYSYEGLPYESVVTSSYWGSYSELKEVLALAASGKIKSQVRTFPLSSINDAFDLLRLGKVAGRAVIIP